jgi:hypothetical protein
MAGGRAVVFVGEFVAPGLAPFSGLVGGSVGEQRVAAGFPAGSGESEGADDQDGFVVGVVGGADGSVFMLIMRTRNQANPTTKRRPQCSSKCSNRTTRH